MWKGCWALLILIASLGADAPSSEKVQARSPVEAGRYLVRVGACNDCHTPGWMQQGSAIPEEAWLTGVPVGWRGPWGTSYGSNLRLFAKDFDEDTWIAVLRARNARPPMPWEALHAMSDVDLRAIFQYIRSLPVTGEKMPVSLPPGVEPSTPYMSMEPVMPASATTQPTADAEQP